MTDDAHKDAGDIQELLAIMGRLRDPNGGCPWDLEQDFSTIAPYTIEEAYEVAEAIEAEDHAALKDELGDLLFQVVFHAQMAAEAKRLRLPTSCARFATRWSGAIRMCSPPAAPRRLKRRWLPGMRSSAASAPPSRRPQ